ncbi:MAG: glycosyltransferase family 4 protein [Lacunisphaera sp.]|nr:glycosyltransferase family 4 protein [Lacunisphaera sp.]
MRILFLSQWFTPEPDFKGLPFARELQRRGHEVVVLTGFPNYPGGKVYPGYRIRFWQWEKMDGIEVLRVPLYPSHDRSAIGRVLNYASFAVAATVLGLLKIRRVDVAYVYHPPATIGLPALAFQWLRGVPCVYDVQDLWPDTLAATGMVRSRALLGLAGYWSNFIYRHVTHAVVLSPGFKARLIERGVKPGNVSVIYNWSPDARRADAPTVLLETEQRLLANRFNVVFAGNLGAAQGLDTVLAAAGLLQSTQPAVQFVFVGDGVDAAHLKADAARRALANVLFLPRRPAAAMGAMYATADALLVHLRDDPLFEITIPSKTQAYLAAGRPILMAVRGDAAALVTQAGAGLCCEPGNAAQLAALVRQLLAMPEADRIAMGAAGSRFYEEVLDLRRGVQAFENLFVHLRIVQENAALKVL